MNRKDIEFFRKDKNSNENILLIEGIFF